MDSPWRAPLSQHFLWNRRLVDRLVRASSLSPHDTVLEIGPGRGALTAALLPAVARVIAVEIDPRLCRYLRAHFGHDPRFTLVQGDCRTQPLPPAPFKVFASLPYWHTSAILHKLLEAAQPPTDCYLIVQREAAQKWCPRATGNSLVALLHYPWWEAAVLHHFQRSDFDPPPSVDSVLLRCQRRAAPLFALRWRTLYQDFVAHRFERDRRAKDLSPEQMLQAFRRQAQNVPPAQRRVFTGAYRRLLAQQQRLPKVHRTRTDPHWKRFGR
jgi:23S rRNA (adenine-N6)-dimethyltransferase